MIQDNGAVAAEIRTRPTLWTFVVSASQAWKFLISILSTIVLGRLLLPTDFGLVATIGPIVALADLLRDLGFTQAIIQRKSISNDQVNALFWLSVAVTFFIACILSSSSFFVARFFGDPRLQNLLIAMSWILLLGSVSAVPLAWLNRNMRFIAISMIEVGATSLGFAGAALAARFTHSYWSLVLSSVIYSIITAICGLAACGWRPGLPKFDRAVREMAKFGAGVSTANIASFVARNADNLFIAKVNGPIALGVYDRAYKLMLVPLSQITWPISRIVIPMLSRQVDDPQTYRTIYNKSITILMMIGQPGLVFSIVFAQPVINLLLGSRWIEVAPIFSWLGISSLQQIVTSSVVWLFISQGRGKDFAILGMINSLIAVSSFAVGVYWGPLGVAASFTIADTLIRFPFSWWFTTRSGPVSINNITKTFLPHVAAISACVMLLKLTRTHFPELNLVEFFLGLSATYLAYIATLILFRNKRDLVMEMLAPLKKRALQRLRRPQSA